MLLSGFVRKLSAGKLRRLMDVQKALNTWLERYNRKSIDLNGGKSPWEMMTGKAK